MLSTLDAALELADLQFPVFPVRLIDNDKVPAIKGWRHRASINPHQIKEWFASGEHLIGVPTGEPSGIDVLDIDPRHGGDRWLQDHKLPVTRWHDTRRGGRHFLFRRFEGMRNSTGKIAPGVDVRAEGGFIVHWPSHGYAQSADPIAAWPDWLAEQAMRGLARRRNGQVGLDLRKPPSPRDVVDLLHRMPNPLEASRDLYVNVMLASKGCIDALIEAGEIDFDDEAAIGEAAIAWAERWEGEAATDEAEKWENDWSHRDAKLAGWQTLSRIAGELIPSYREEQCAKEFADPPDVAPYHGNPHWHSMLHVTKNGGARPVLINAVIALRYAPEWQGVLAMNNLASALELSKRPPWQSPDQPFAPRQFTDNDSIHVTTWLHKQHIYVSVPVTDSAVREVALDNTYHPVHAYLDSLVWDGQKRLDTWLIDHLGAEDTALNRAFGARFLISAVARVRKPGCQVDTVPILEGDQGLGKSMALRTLARPWFTDHVPDLQSKDAQLQIQGVWVVEFAEYGQLGRADANRAKLFISIQDDRLRRPYGTVAGEFARQCVFAVTLNRPALGYLRDETGNRRFWPVACGVDWPAVRRIDLKALARARNQIWAEADHRYGQGEAWWLHEPDLLAAHERVVVERMDLGPWHDRVVAAMEDLISQGKTEPTFTEICASLGLLSTKEITLQAQNHIGRALTALGWVGRRRRDNGDRHTFYKR